MKRLLVVVAAFVVALALATPQPHARQWFPYPGVGPGPTATPFSPITHVIVIMQENRTVDNMFNGFPGANTVTHMLASDGTDVTLQPSPNGIQNSCDMSHSYASAQLAANASAGRSTMFQGGRTGFDLEPIADGNCTALGGSTRGAFTYVPQTYVQPYWDAVTFDGQLNDNTFGNLGPSAPAHCYEAAATCRMTTNANLGVSDNDVPGTTNFNCINKGTTNFIDMTVAYPAPIATVQPSCVTDPTQLENLVNHGKRWFMNPVSVNPSGTEAYWVFPAMFTNTCLPLNGSGTGCNNSIFLNGVGHTADPAPNLVTQITTCGLNGIDVWYYIPKTAASDHPNTTTNGGPQAVTNIINAVGNASCSNGSATWANTVIVVLWDDWGGFADHVVPPVPAWAPTSTYELGFRVPLMVIAAYSKSPGTVDHTQGDSMGCLNAFIEKIESIPGPLSTVSIDQFCTNDWTTTMLNLAAGPRAFVTISN